MEIAAEHEEDKSYIRVPIVKATTKDDPSFVEVCVEDLPDDVYKEVMLQGLKTLLNRGMSKITGAKTDASRKAVMEIAGQTLQNLYQGKVRMSAGVRTKVSGVTKTEAMRIARLLIRDALKRAGEKVSHYAAKEITALATELLNGEQGKDILAQAQAAIAERETKEKELQIDLSSIKPDAGLVKKANERAAKAKKPTAVPHKERPGQHANR